MRRTTVLRVLLALVATVCGVALVLGYRTVPPARDRLADRVVIGPPHRQGHAQHRCRAGGGERRVAGPTTAWPLGHLRVGAKLVGCRIVDVTVVELATTNAVSRRRSLGAVNQLRRQVLSEQCGSVDVVTGATYTSRAYLRSLQAVLDATHAGRPCR